MAIKVRRGNKADLVIANLVAGEPVFALDTKEFGIKANDGTMVWVGTLNANGKVNQDALNALSLGGVLASTIIDGSGNAQNALKLGGNLASLYPTISSGTWTPTIYGKTTAGSPTIEFSNGLFYRIGKFVFISYNIGLINKGSMAGTVCIGGLPYVVNGYGATFITSYFGITPTQSYIINGDAQEIGMMDAASIDTAAKIYSATGIYLTD